MPISDYSPIRDDNANIIPGNIRSRHPEEQQTINSIRQIMADLAGGGVGGAGAVGEGKVLKILNGVPTWVDNGWELIAKANTTGYIASAVFTDLSAYSWIRISIRLNPQTNNHSVGVQISTNNGSSYVGSGYDYQHVGWSLAAGTSGGAAAAVGGFYFNAVAGVNSGAWLIGAALMGNFNKADHLYWDCNSTFLDGAAGTLYKVLSGGRLLSTTPRNAFRIIDLSGGNIQAYYTIEGIRG